MRRGVSIVAPTAMQADALASAVCVMGPTTGLQMVQALSDVECIVVEKTRGENRRFRTPGLERRQAHDEPPAR